MLANKIPDRKDIQAPDLFLLGKSVVESYPWQINSSKLGFLEDACYEGLTKTIGILSLELILARGFVKFVPGIAYHFCLNWPSTFSQPHTSIISHPSTLQKIIPAHLETDRPRLARVTERVKIGGRGDFISMKKDGPTAESECQLPLRDGADRERDCQKKKNSTAM